MAKVSEMYPSEWLRAEDLKGRQVKVRIETVEIGQFRNFEGEKEQKPVISFVGAKKKLILNKRQALQIRDIHGDDTDGWPGKDVAMYAQPTPQGKQTIVIVPVPVAGEGGGF